MRQSRPSLVSVRTMPREGSHLRASIFIVVLIEYEFSDVIMSTKAWTNGKKSLSVVFPFAVFDHVAEERIKILEKEVLYMRENQERVLQERVESKVQQRVEQEVSHLRQQSDDRFKSMEKQWSCMISDMTLSSRSFSNLALPSRESSYA
ncbi:hypothetical protein CQW23_31481 [Capsicum baccatum]|uniref:Uncharacterized protein n=1 Tax=Capsicum baccatum TaxID=33114 RepID=A0A2G2V7H1_CAPBA|nr:hypothetical protein CQW23_31481 [Capsicum baccatum]